MPGSWRDKLQAPFTSCIPRLRSRSRNRPALEEQDELANDRAPQAISPSTPEEQDEPANDPAPQEISPSTPEVQPPSAQHHNYPALEPSRPSPPPSRPSDSARQPAPEICGLFIFGDKQPPGDYNIDIVAVHGLGGHWEKTWTDENSNKLWLRDFLPSQLPNARIMSYGYDSCTAFSKAVTDIDVEAAMLLYRLNCERQGERTRPIIFISHSLGGIVVKKALILAHERSSEYGDLLNSVRGSIFFGVPHRGADAAYWASFAATIIKVTQFGLGTNKSFVSALRRNSETFASISRQFVERAAPLVIRTFYETERLFGQLIVDQDSACLGLANEIAVGVAGADHKTMCKFSKIDSQKYIPVWRTIEVMSNSAVACSAASSAPPSTPPSAPLSKEDCECLQSLYTSDYNSHRERVPPAAQGTCTWVLRHKRYTAWRTERESSLLWVSADPGCGKSVLSSFLVKTLRSAESQAVLPGTVCFFFFKDDNDEQKSATFALCALLHQLFEMENTLIPHALADFKSKGQKLTGELYTLWKIFAKAATDSGNVICVIDGLDECEKLTRSVLVNSLVKFYSNRCASKGHLKIVLTSRPYQSIEDGFHDLPRIRLRGEDETNSVSVDVELAIGDRVKKLGSRRSLQENVQANLQASLTKGADRTFLWVSLILGILENTPEASEREFDEIINNLPADLDAVYEKILGNSPKPERAKKILHIVVAAARPLTVDEMNVALAIQPHHKSIKELESNLIPSIEQAVKELCGLFVRVIDSKIYLVHQTAKEFLINDLTSNDLAANNPNSGTWKRALYPVESNSVVANICTSYLLLTDFEANPLLIDIRSKPVKEQVDLYASKHTFLDYAAKHWAVHFREIQTQGKGDSLEVASEVYRSGSNRFLTWFQVYWNTVETDYICPQGLTDLMVASYFGHEAVVQLLLERGANINEHEANYGSALNMAALGGHRAAVQLLLDNGANFYSYGKEYTNLLQVGKPFQHRMTEAMANSRLVLR